MDLTKDSKDPKELLMRLSCHVIKGNIDKALDEIEENQCLIEQKYQLRLMKLHFELLLSKKLYDDARLALKHYENLPYVSQEVEEFMREMKDRIEDESHPKSSHKFELDEIYDILEKETEESKISQVLFSLKNYNINIYIDSLKIFLKREDVNPNFRTYALILLIDEKVNLEIEFLSRKGIIRVNPSKLVPPFSGEGFGKVCELISLRSQNDISLTKTALHLLNCYVIDTYPEDIFNIDLEKIASAFIRIAESYLGHEVSSKDEEIAKLSEEIRKIIESTPEIRL